jgi:SDR family mycofactocin-dependent oxidoreductase
VRRGRGAGRRPARAPLASAAAAGWRQIAAACQPHGTLVLAGLGHTGLQGSSAYSQAALWGPSDVPDPVTREVPMEMAGPDIAALTAGFAAAAGSAAAAGADGVEIDAGPGALLRQFHSGLTNHRDDGYGTDRLRLTREVLAAVRDAIGPLGLRLSCDELAPWAGVTPEAGVEHARELSRWLDLLVVVRGGLYAASAYRPGAHTAPMFNAALARQVRDALDGAVPVVLQGSVTGPHAARDALDQGACDLVEMTRAQIADAGAFITGAARGQGRSHAIRLAQEGANVIAVNLCRQIDSVAYPMATPDDLAETVKEVEALDRRIVAREADVRDEAGLKAAFDAGVAELGPVDIVLANAGIAPMTLGEEPHQAWQDVIDVNLTGVFNTVETAIPSMIERGQGDAIVLTSSTAGIGGATRGGLGYTASKHGVVGLMRSYANTLAPHSIRVNSVHPTGVRTPMVVNEVMQQFLESDPAMGQAMANALPVDMVEPVDISNAILWLVSDDGRYVTGITVPVDAGFTNKK